MKESCFGVMEKQNRFSFLGRFMKARYEELVSEEIRPVIFTKEAAAAFGKAACKLGRPGRIHLALDTGMSRIGMDDSSQSADLAAQIASYPGIEIEGLFTHFAKADETDKTSANHQMERYRRFCEKLAQRESGFLSATVPTALEF